MASRARNGAVPAIVDPFEFLSRACGSNQVSLGPGVCFNCPALLPGTLAQVQAAALQDAGRINISPRLENIGKAYCGTNPFILYWTAYQMRHSGSGRHAGFKSPFHYSRIASPSECFSTGKSVGAIIGSKNNGGNFRVAPAQPRPREPAVIVPRSPVVEISSSSSSSSESESESKYAERRPQKNNNNNNATTSSRDDRGQYATRRRLRSAQITLKELRALQK